MPQFTPQRSRPLRPESIRAAVRRQRKLCEIIERHADSQDAREKQQLTRAINGLAYHALELSRRHRQQSLAEDIHAQHRADCYDAAHAEAITQEDCDGADHAE